ncbi:hypothetical protein AMECASPLE_024933 [Ameca splendens]|uniref:Secreted protein n=1 Tax=Ameca splendens TaxID=208324 RepID=A0ABV0XTL2_9TELE
MLFFSLFILSFLPQLSPPSLVSAATHSHLIAFSCSPCLFSTLAPLYIFSGFVCPPLVSSVSLLPAMSCFSKNPTCKCLTLLIIKSFDSQCSSQIPVCTLIQLTHKS